MSEHQAVKDLLAPGDPGMRMSAYYYEFEPTGVGIIDRILSAVATAGKSYQHTEGWQADDYGMSAEQSIQKAANDAAAALRGVSDQADETGATVKRHRAPSGNQDNDRFQPMCPACGWAGGLYSNRVAESRRLAKRDAEQHRCPTTSPEVPR